MDDPIVITGMGALAAGTATVDALYAAALSGESPADWLAMPPLEPIAGIRAPDPDFPPGLARHARRLDRAARLGLAAAADAIGSAGLAGSMDPHRIGVMVGTSRGPIARTLEMVRDLDQGGIAPTAVAESTLGSMSGVICQAFSLGGPSATIAATCASAANAIAMGAMHLVTGDADAMVVGGSEAPIIPLLVAQLRAAGVIGSHEVARLTCRPFDSRRNGLVIGEGAAFLVLERASGAARRGAAALARLTGWATGTDGGGRTGITPDGEGTVRVIGRALSMAGLEPHEIGYVNAHGTGTRLNDALEARVFNSIFGVGNGPPVSSTKPITGHCLGATPAIEAVICVQAVRAQCAPPTSGHQQLDPDCAIDVVSTEARRLAAKAAILSTSLGFWGYQGRAGVRACRSTDAGLDRANSAPARDECRGTRARTGRWLDRPGADGPGGSRTR